jgi:hypothetical protein
MWALLAGMRLNFQLLANHKLVEGSNLLDERTS